MQTHSIQIDMCLNGYMVRVGCQTLAYTERAKLLKDLANYLADPKKTEQRFLDTEAYNKEFVMRAPRANQLSESLADCDPRGVEACDISGR